MKKTLLALVVCLNALPVMAQDSGTSNVILHGFGEWAYTRTDEHEYLGGSEDGDYDTAGFGLNASTTIGENLTLVGQLALRSRGEETQTAQLDYAFAQWRFSDFLQLRAGRVKHPFGIYTEIYDIGTLRPFFHLPQSIYGPAEVAAQSINGIVLTGNRPTGSTSIDYDVYVGEIEFANIQRIEEEEGEEASGEEAGGEHVSDSVGFRIRYNTALDGLSVGASAYTGVVEHHHHEEGEEEEEEEGSGRHRTFGFQAEYARNALMLRAEVGSHEEEGEGTTKGGYLEGSYRLGKNFELAARYDRFDGEVNDVHGEASQHRDLAFGVNYWFNPNFVLKASLHHVKGDAVVSAEDDSAHRGTTNALVIGTQFSF